MIVVGLLAAVPLGLSGVLTALIGVVAIWVYFLLDLCDGEVARWRRQTSVTGVYLDRVGHYLVEAAVLTAYGFRAGGQELGGWTTLGVAAGLFVVLVKAETDLVDVARTRSGLRGGQRGVGRAAQRRAGQGAQGGPGAQGAPADRRAGVLAAAGGRRRGGRRDRHAARHPGAAVALAAIAAVMTVLHLASILLSRRLD